MRVVLPLDEGPEMPIIMALLSLGVIFFFSLCSLILIIRQG